MALDGMLDLMGEQFGLLALGRHRCRQRRGRPACHSGRQPSAGSACDSAAWGGAPARLTGWPEAGEMPMLLRSTSEATWRSRRPRMRGSPGRWRRPGETLTLAWSNRVRLSAWRPNSTTSAGRRGNPNRRSIQSPACRTAFWSCHQSCISAGSGRRLVPGTADQPLRCHARLDARERSLRPVSVATPTQPVVWQ